MDDELKQYLTGMEGRLAEGVEQRLKAMEQRLEGKIDATADRLRTELGVKIRETETALLTEFSSWSNGNHVRIGQVETMQKTLLSLEQGNAERMASLEGRMLSLEKRIWTKGA